MSSKRRSRAAKTADAKSNSPRLHASGIAPDQTHPAPRSHRSLILAIGILLAVAIAGWYVATEYSMRRAIADKASHAPKESESSASTTEIPTVTLEGVDPAVVRALQDYQRRVQENRRSAVAWGEYGEVLLAHEYYEAARAAFAEAGRLAPRDPMWPYLRGRSFDGLGHEEAAAPLEEAVRLAGDEPDAPLLTLVELYLALDRSDDAKKTLGPFLAKHPDNARANLAMGRLLFKEGDLDRALEQARKAENHKSLQKSAHQLIGQIYLRQGNADKAREYQNKSLQLTDAGWDDPFFRQVTDKRTGLKAILVRADRLFGLNRVQETIPLLRQAVQAYPDSDWAHVLLGRSLIREKQYAEAEKYLRRAVGLAPESAEAQFRLGVAMSRQNRQRDAIDWFRRAIRLKPDFTTAHSNLGYCLESVGDAPGAIEAFTAAASLEPANYEFQAILGTLLAKEGRNDEAISHWKNALSLKPDDANATAALQQLETTLASP